MKGKPYPSPSRVINPKTLSIAWHNGKDSKGQGGAPGIDKFTATAFSRKLTANIQKIAEQIKSREYKFQPLRASPLAKGDGNFRIICVPTVRDRLVQRAILNYLTLEKDRLGVMNDSSYGAFKGSSKGSLAAVDAALRERCKKPYVLKTDISKFFDNIPRDYLRAKLHGKLKRHSIVPLLDQVIDSEISCFDPATKQRIEAAGIQIGKGLRQGMPLSPLLSNLVLKAFDKKLRLLGKTFIRYVDDLAVFEDSEIECRKTAEIVKLELKKIQLSIPSLEVVDSKTQILGPNDALNFLGLSIYKQPSGSYAKRIPDDAFVDLHLRLTNDVSYDFFEGKDARKSKTLGEYNNWFDGLVSGYAAAYRGATNLDHFKEVAEKEISKAKVRLLEQVLGTELLKTIDEKKRRFLEL